MDVRKKLVELLKNNREHYLATYIIKHRKSYEEYTADHLIAHGVTVQEWIPVTERLPEHGNVVICFMKFGEQRILQWDNVSSWWLGYEHGDDWQKADITHWMPMPQPPKAERGGKA